MLTGHVCLFQADVLFPPELHSLAAKLQEALNHGVLLPRPSVSVEDNERHWIEWHEVGRIERDCCRLWVPL